MKNLPISLAIMAAGSGMVAGLCAIALGLIAISNAQNDDYPYQDIRNDLKTYMICLLFTGFILMVSSIVVAIKYGREKQ